MSKKHRITSTILHVIVRGNGKQILFEDSSDYKYFLSQLQKYRDETGIILLAYCLMDNHVHLLISDPKQAISLFMQKLSISYAAYYNRKYGRVGHVFQGRFMSENITTEAYLLTAFRYILKNPEKAIIAKVSDYPWNSYHEYGRADGLTDSSIFTSLIGNADSFNEFLAVEDDTEIMEMSPRKHDDEWALNVIRSVCHVTSGTAISQLPKQQRDEMLALLKSMGLSIRQLARLTGIGRGVVSKAKASSC